MARIVVTGRLLKWGNSFGIRIRKADLQRAGIKEGSDVEVRILGAGGRIDLSDAPSFRGGRRDDSVRHDELLAEHRWARLQAKRRGGVRGARR